MVDNKAGPSDAPKPPPPPPPPTDNSAARKAASAVANQEVKKPPQGELLKTNVQDKVQQARQGGALAFERVRDTGAAARNAVGDTAGAARGKAAEIAAAAKQKVPELVKKGAAIAGAGGLVIAGNAINTARFEANMAKLSPHTEHPALVEKTAPAAKVAEVSAPKQTPQDQQKAKQEEAVAETRKEQIEQEAEGAESIQTLFETVGEKIDKRRNDEAAKNRDERRHD
jgi:hypothetical protein